MTIEQTMPRQYSQPARHLPKKSQVLKNYFIFILTIYSVIFINSHIPHSDSKIYYLSGKVITDFTSPFLSHDAQWASILKNSNIDTTDNKTDLPQREFSQYHSTGTEEDEKFIWNFLMQKIQNPNGVAGLMGNLYIESKLRSYNLQSTYEKKLNMTDKEYTTKVDSGEYTNFANDRAGYGLAQWTYHTRKEKLLDYAQASHASIGDLEMQLNFLWWELTSEYRSVVEVLKNAESIYEASTKVMIDFESPSNQTKQAKNYRASCGQVYYDKYASAPMLWNGPIGPSQDFIFNFYIFE